MYEATFGLKRRPFAATPDASCFLSSGPIQGALDELIVCVEQGQGIAVLTSPAGTGKTLLCERLCSELDHRFETVLLRHASFLTRRALLQTILCELHHPYHHPSEQELRLELLPTIRALAPQREALVLICDEAHQLSDSLLEELRILADFAEAGRPLVRLVLVGQPSLEEKLAQPGLAAFNQRIRAQISLAPFDHAGSLDYIDYRLTWAGGRTDEIFTPTALELIAVASDGVPRCINQLADHTLLLAFVAEQRPAGVELVREALNDLRQLPLHWNEPATRYLEEPAAPQLEFAETAGSAKQPELLINERVIDDRSAAPAESGSAAWASIELGSGDSHLATWDEHSSTPVNRIEVGSVEWRKTVEAFTPMTPMENRSAELSIDPPASRISHSAEFHELLQDAYAAAGEEESMDHDHRAAASDPVIVATPVMAEESTHELNSSRLTDTQWSRSTSIKTHTVYEEVIVDRYAAIDAGLTPPESDAADTVESVEVHTSALVEDSSSFGASTSLKPAMIATLPSSSGETADCHQSIEVSEQCTAEAAPLVVTATPSNVNSCESIPECQKTVVEEPMASNCTLTQPTVVAEMVEEPTERTSRVRREIVEFSSVSCVVSGGDDVKQLADEVFSLGKSLHPAGVLSSNSHSILNALRREVVELENQNSGETAMTANSTPAPDAWNVVETTPAESEHRPFRYLFSLLRRKQQGLA